MLIYHVINHRAVIGKRRVQRVYVTQMPRRVIIVRIYCCRKFHALLETFLISAFLSCVCIFLCVLANVNSRLRLLHVVAHPSVSLSVCRLSVTFLRPTQPVEIFGNVCTPFARLPWPSVDIQVKFYGDCSRGTPPSGEGLNARGVAEYNDFVLSKAISRKLCKIEGTY